jgi:hypothetical protein
MPRYAMRAAERSRYPTPSIQTRSWPTWIPRNASPAQREQLQDEDTWLFDALYLSTRRGRRLRHFPELSWPANFSRRELREWTLRVFSPRKDLICSAHDRAPISGSCDRLAKTGSAVGAVGCFLAFRAVGRPRPRLLTRSCRRTCGDTHRGDSLRGVPELCAATRWRAPKPHTVAHRIFRVGCCARRDRFELSRLLADPRLPFPSTADRLNRGFIKTFRAQHGEL